MYNDFSSRKARHKEILALYKEKVSLYKRGRFVRAVVFMLFVAWCAILLEAAFRYFHLPWVDFDAGKISVYFMAGAMILVSVAVFRPYRLWTDKTYFGVIEKIEFQSGQVVQKGRSTHKPTYSYYGGSQKIYIRRKRGRLIAKEVPAFYRFNSVYGIDTPISVICGVKLPVPMDLKKIDKGHGFCTKCGSFEPDELNRCCLCHETVWYK